MVTLLAYRPALIFSDSVEYLVNAAHLHPHPTRPIGYPLFLAPLLHLHNLSYVAFAQHLLGLAAATLLYITLLRLSVRRWLAALGAAGLLLDGYQLAIEQWVLSDTLFEFLLVLGHAILVWHRRPGWRACLACGLVLGFAVWVRLDGAAMVVPALIYVAVVQVGWRRLAHLAAVVVAFAGPLVGYASWFKATEGHFSLSGSSGHFLYARVATFADCSKVNVPPYERPLCPSGPPSQRLPTNCYAWCPQSPFIKYQPPPGRSKDAVARDFAERIMLHQPGAYAKTVLGDFLHAFESGRGNRPQDIQDQYWRFTVDYPYWARPDEVKQMVHRFGGAGDAGPAVHPSLTRFLRAYQGVAYVQGPLLAAGLVIGLLAALGIGRAGKSGLRCACLLWVLGGVAVVAPAYLVSGFTWRYEIPLLIFYPTALVLGLHAIFGPVRRDPVRRVGAHRASRKLGE